MTTPSVSYGQNIMELTEVTQLTGRLTLLTH